MTNLQNDGSKLQDELRLTAARERVARLAERDGEVIFAREVRAGCWDHREDVQAALRGEKLMGEDWSK
jgi:hypothetical protein